MSRIGKLAINIPAGVSVDFKDGLVTVTGPKGALKQKIEDKHINIKIEGAQVHVERSSEDKAVRSKHGLYRQLINNMVQGVVTPFSRTLLVNGVGWKAAVSGKKLTLNVGYSHPVDFNIPEGISIACPDQNTIVVTGVSKELVGQTAATIKSKRPVEPYHAYGIRYNDEVVVMKEGKKGK